MTSHALIFLPERTPAPVHDTPPRVRLVFRGWALRPFLAAGLAAYAALTGIGLFLGLLLGSV